MLVTNGESCKDKSWIALLIWLIITPLPFSLSLNSPDWRLAWRPTSMLFSSFSRGRSLLYHLLTALYRLLPSLLTHLACMELGQQCCTACTPFPPYRWTAEHPHRYSIVHNNTYIVSRYVGYKRFRSMWFLYSRALPRLTLNSPRSPRSHCRVEPMWLWHQTTPCSRPLKLRPIQGWLHSCPSYQSNPPSWRTRGCAAASATRHCPETWTSPQDWLRPRNTSQTLHCLSSEDHHFESSNALLLTDILKEPYD